MKNEEENKQVKRQNRRLFRRREGKMTGFYSEGRFVIPPIYEYATLFFGGTAFVKYEGKWGIIDETGAYIAEPIYEEVSRYTKDVAELKLDGKLIYIDRAGAIVDKPEVEGDQGAEFGRAKFEDQVRLMTASIFDSSDGSRP